MSAESALPPVKPVLTLSPRDSAEVLAEPAPEVDHLVHRGSRVHPLARDHVDPGPLAIGRDVGGEALEQVGMLAHRPGRDQQAVERVPADRILEDLRDLLHRPAGPFGDLPRTGGGVRQLLDQGLARVARRLVVDRSGRDGGRHGPGAGVVDAAPDAVQVPGRPFHARKQPVGRRGTLGRRRARCGRKADAAARASP